MKAGCRPPSFQPSSLPCPPSLLSPREPLGTFAIMIAIALPMAEAHQANLLLVVAATLGGGVFGDHCSPISDTTIISSMASASDHIDHVRT
ncbi:MAG: Na+/H+ antiporter NhaC family protein [Bacteroidales bacterium]